MDPLERQLNQLLNFNTWVAENDPRLFEEAIAAAEAAKAEMPARELALTPETLGERMRRESIVLRTMRPVLAIKQNVTELDFKDGEDSETWKERLTKAEAALARPIRAVGRINLSGSDLAWVGTGWLIAEKVLVTNRHVARRFAQRNGEGFTFAMGERGRIRADVDFLQEIDSGTTLSFELKEVLHIVDLGGPDIAFFAVAGDGDDGELAAPIRLAENVAATRDAAVIGYPAYDSRIPEPNLMEEIFDKKYNKKRLAPGAVTAVTDDKILHNCSTLGGNSGSAVVNFMTGEVLGLHFSGAFLTTNYAVRADIVRGLLEDVRSKRARRRLAARARPALIAPQVAASAAPVTMARASGANSTTITLPLTITVSLGAPAPQISRLRALPGVAEGDGEVEGEEAVAADYRDREGYDPAFLAASAEVALPAVTENAGDVLNFSFEGKSETELKYMHYSIVMSRSRRMCFFSAVNIDGNQSKKSARVAWKWDPRIPRAQQIMNECCGHPPKFSRGHMTRREDPGWGNGETARRGNEDSMHVTNTTPQMQAFNAPIWLALEDYALQHAREDAMKISVFTGPYFAGDDPERYGVRIPVAFWKVIAFIHDDTGELCATGYEMSQQHTLQLSEEYVFGGFTSPQLQVATQVPIAAIEMRAGVSFGRLASIDPLASEEATFGEGGARVPLQALEQIRFF
jgi:endonuclease G